MGKGKDLNGRQCTFSDDLYFYCIDKWAVDGQFKQNS